MVSIAIDALSVHLGKRPVLDGISATLDPGHLIGVIGPNGAGKSTLVRAILGLTKIASGSVRIDDLTALPPRDLARRIAYLPQGQTLHWPLSVERLVALGRLPHLAPLSRMSTADETIITEALNRADITHLAKRNAIELSGGERARVLLARALAVGASALIADEPLASLDPGHQIDVMALLRREADAGGLVIAVLHDLSMAARYCDRLLLIDGGKLVADGSPAEVLTAERLATVYGIRADIICENGRSMIVPIDRIPE